MRQNSISGWAKLDYRSGPCRSIGAEAQHALRMEHGVYASRSIQCGRPGAGFGPVYGGAHMSAAALEKHYRVREVAALWGFSDNTIIGIFASEPGVSAWTRALADVSTQLCRYPKALPCVFTRDSARSRSRRSFRLGTHFA